VLCAKLAKTFVLEFQKKLFMVLQEAFFTKIKTLIADKKELPQVLQDLLQISADSAYRRIRCETALSLDEAFKLSNHFKIAFSDLESFRNDHVIFARKPFINSLSRFESYMRRSLENLEFLQKDPKHLMVYSALDIPIFYPHKYPELSAFKMFVWMRSAYDIESVKDAFFDMTAIPDSLLELAQKQWLAYSKTNTIEIWNKNTIQSLLDQIAYYFEAGLLPNKDEALKMCDQLADFLKLIYKQTLFGKRLSSENEDQPATASYQLFYNEVAQLDNHIISRLNGRLNFNLPYGAVNYLTTTNPSLNQDVYEHLIRQTEQSVLVNTLSDKDRNAFFTDLRNRIEALKKRLEESSPFIV